MLEALERLLYDKYIETHEPLSPQGTASLEKLSPRESSLAEVLSSADVTGHIAKYKKFRETVRNGELGETGRFWLEYMDCIWLVLSLNNAIKTNDYDRYKSAINRMPDLFSAQISRITLDFSYITATLRKRTLLQRNYYVLGLSVLPDHRLQATAATLTKQ